MTPTLTTNPSGLRDALYALSIAKEAPDASLLDEMVRRFPQFSRELTEFAIAIAIDALRGDAAVAAAEATCDPDVTSPAVARAMSRFQNRLHGEMSRHVVAFENGMTRSDALNPFASLKREEFRAFARRLNVNSVFVAKLRDRQIDFETMTPGFQRLVAGELAVPLEVVIKHFAAIQTSAERRPFFKADSKPTDGGRQTFEEAVRSSGLTEEQQRTLLAL